MSSTFLSEETARYYEDMWIAYQLKNISSGKYWFLNVSQFGKCRKEWWSIVSDEKWDKIISILKYDGVMENRHHKHLKSIFVFT